MSTVGDVLGNVPMWGCPEDSSLIWNVTVYLYKSSDSLDLTSLKVSDFIVLQLRCSTVVEMETSFKYDIMIIIIVN